MGRASLPCGLARSPQGNRRMSKYPVYLTLLLLLSACRYTTFPLIPTPIHGQFPVQITGHIGLQGGNTVLQVRLLSRESGYFEVLWFENGLKVSEDSRYVDPAHPTATFRLRGSNPSARAVVSFGGSVLREFELQPPKLRTSL